MESQLKLAFEQSILKWHEIVYNGGTDRGINNCELCIRSINYNSFDIMTACKICPINKKTNSCCKGTPYTAWKNYCTRYIICAWGNWPLPGLIVFDSHSQELAYRELVFLENLYCKLLFEEEVTL